MLTKPRDKKVVVFLCTGDTCRGPMAQGYMKRKLEEKGIGYMEVRTAGVMTVAGLVPTPEAKQVMDKEGIDISKHRSAPLTKELRRRSDIVLGMTPFHVQFAKRLDEDTKDKAVLLKEFAKSDMKNYQVTDPMGATLEVYKRVYREIKLAVDRLMEHEFVLNPPSDEIDIPAPRPRPASPPPVPAPAAKAENGAAKPKVAEKPVAPAKKGSPAGKGAPAKKPGKPALKSVVRKPLAAVAKKDGGKKK